ncbi:MAG TPA: hypothetical protein VN844_18785 [Pyrinomonadaceae bacterium]|nr:hypothetical protein [Pyrinomonadaceae bacterium]
MSNQLRRPTKIMLLRHAEKPAKDDAPFGVTRKGERSKESLEVRGWQRAGALANLFASANGHSQHPVLAKPQFLYASKPLLHKGSLRPLETIMPLGEKLGIKINADYQRSQLVSMVEDVFSHKGVVLICWQREYIPDIAAIILGKNNVAPSDWPEDRFDMIWVFDLHGSSSTYRFRQVPQQLLAGDSIIPIK